MARPWRLLIWILGGVLLLVAILFLVYEMAATSVAEAELSSLLGVEVEIGAISGLHGTDLTLRRVRLGLGGRVVSSVDIGRAEVKLERPLYEGQPKVGSIRLQEVVLEVDLQSVLQKRREAREKKAAQGEPQPQEPDTGPTEKPAQGRPGAASRLARDLQALPATVSVARSTIKVNLGGESGHEYVIPVENVSATLKVEQGMLARLDQISGEVLGGKLAGNGTLGFENPEDWHLQLRVNGVSVAAAVRGTSLAETKSTGALSAFLDMHGPGSRSKDPLGAGWVTVDEAHVWDAPMFRTSLDTMGVKAGEKDELKQARARFRLDRGRFYFEELLAVGSPMSLYGNGSVKLDGTELEADLVPRFGKGEAGNVPFIGRPTQVALDVLKGAAISIQIRGSIDHPSVSTVPVPVITAPLRSFFKLVGG